MSVIPASHIIDSHQLIADGRLDLWELTPSGGGTGTVYFKPDADATWQGHTYTGLPVGVSGEKKTSDSGLVMPQLTLGDTNTDLSEFKSLVNLGYLDNCILVRRTVLLNNMINNYPISEDQFYRCKRVMSYSRTQIQMQLATISDSLGFSMPYRSYTQPDFPSVQY